jgi:transcriptional regulator with XRE-family HTH domain
LKSPRPQPLRPKRYKRRQKLHEFGEAVKSAREVVSPSQQKAVEVLARHDLKVSQSWVAQLETGRITDPDPEILRKIEAAYGIDYDRLVYALIRDKYRLNDSSFVSSATRNRWNAVERLIPGLSDVSGKQPLYEYEQRAKETLLSQEVLDLEGLAAWQRSFPDLKEVWASGDLFLDDRIPLLHGSVLENLKRGVRFFFFMDKRDLDEGKPFWLFLHRIYGEVRSSKVQQQIRTLPLEEAELRWMTSGFMLTNPTDASTRTGFLVIRSSQSARFAFRMADRQVEATTSALVPFLVKKIGRREFVNRSGTNVAAKSKA